MQKHLSKTHRLGRTCIIDSRYSVYVCRNKQADKGTQLEKSRWNRVCFAPSAHVSVMKDRAELKPKVDAEIARDVNVNLNYLETCNVTDMSNLFANKTTFKGDISQWTRAR